MSDVARWRLKPIVQPGVDPPEFGDYVDIESSLTLGRDPGNSVVLEEGRYPHVSAHHARIYLRGNMLWVEDLNSKNGTFVNGSQIQQQPLHTGDSIQLGPLGPRFAVVSTAGSAAETQVGIRVEEGDASKTQRLSRTTILQVKKALGIPAETPIGELLHRRSRTHNLKLLGLLVLIVTGVAIGGWQYLEREQGRTIELQQMRDALSQSDASRRLESDNRKAHVVALEEEKARLLNRIAHLEEAEEASAGNLELLRGELAKTVDKLELYNPVNLEQGRLQEVAGVARAVVLIERKTRYRDPDTLEVIYIGDDDLPNIEERGEPLEREGTGSGFCVSAEGWIITNAHVVLADGPEPALRFEEKTYYADPRLQVVFTGTDLRYDATLTHIDDQPPNDVALLKIEPFDGMPYIKDFSLDAPAPNSGTEVYLFGFPLGKFALQSGEVVIASTFKGILSRRIDPFLQVDAGVYPGNSGGPITDSQGRVIGIVTAVQNTPQGSTAAAIGYGLPLQRLESIWPPKPLLTGDEESF